MTKDRWKTVTSIVDLILEAKPGDQQKIIDNECGHDPELIREVKKFLFSIENSESLWDDLLKSNKILANELTESGALLDDTTTSFIPEQIGVYKLIRLIARGGMGDVFLAERNDGQFKRTVALKILRRELISENYTQRFITEREILSSLDHPNIARLYDGGFTNDGRPYLVMEYIDGEPITSFCTRNECSAEKKLDLFIQICQAVHYAHTNLIVHRDLKPDNIFVTTGGVVKILDFGIAKILDTELSPEMLVQTSTGSRLFSVQYAAPEQITLDKITTSTDVYALGLILYEIITGSKPNNLEAKNLKKAENLIRFQSPESPSRVVANKQLSKKLRGDLDSIILKALRKEPEHRYATVDLLLNDIKRYQHHLPVLAKSGSIKYRCQKFTKR
ncbi:MAG: serine/threonine protein kinase, partial [Balneolaceae bacterium]